MSELINNRERRIETLKEIILHLHRGLPPDQVRARMTDIVREIDATEIAAMEQQLMADGMSVDEIRSMCDLHSEVLRDVVRPAKPQPLIAPGHPVDTFRRENRALREAVAAARAAQSRIAGIPAGERVARELLDGWRGAVHALMDVEKHYQRKEHLLFPCLERHGITGPSKVMWGKDDEVRAALKGLVEALRELDDDADEARVVAEVLGEPALSALGEMVYKEEQILLPMALDTLSEDEWAEIFAESPRFGWCLVEPGRGYRPAEPAVPRDPLAVPARRALVLPGGSLEFHQLQAIFATLPVDLTFVDADDRVAFFSESAHPIFARSRAVIGRKVQHCHPPRSVEVVERILDDFRAGRQDVAEFWIEMRGRFVHIRYFAVRDEQRNYLGTLEVTQDITAIRKLDGERRLLQYADGV
ncbi:MAG: DUF438 domain-containing protein [Acidobacteria bacterium]|nr:DUF438 domain-containing protein [Acidobacteriota bacterium]